MQHLRRQRRRCSTGRRYMPRCSGESSCCSVEDSPSQTPLRSVLRQCVAVPCGAVRRGNATHHIRRECIFIVFTARRYAIAGLCCLHLSVCLCLTHAGIVSKLLNLISRKQRHTIARGIEFFDAKDLGEIRTESHPMGWGAKYRWYRLKLATFDK